MLDTTAEGYFKGKGTMERGGMGETQLLEGRKGLGPNVVLVLILVRILVLFLQLVLVPSQVLVPVLDLGLVAGLELRA